MLSREIKRLHAEPSPICFDFYEKAVAISDMHQRLIFLHRGQRWVTRKLDALLPRVKDAALHHALLQMRDNHEANIGSVKGVIGTYRSGSDRRRLGTRCVSNRKTSATPTH